MNTQYASSSNPLQNNIKDTVTFNDWMFQQYDDNQSSIVPQITTTNKDSFEPQDSPSSTTWFEPLENILSSTTSSSIGSPISTASLSQVKLEPRDNSFEFTLNKLSEQEKLKLETGTDQPSQLEARDVAVPSKGNDGNNRKQLTEHQKRAHNKIEKKYRININTKIAKLQQIIPWLDTEETTFFSCLPDSNNNNSDGCTKDIVPNTKKPRLNKSMILEKAIDYILYLQNNERLYEMEVRRLKSELSQYKS